MRNDNLLTTGVGLWSSRVRRKSSTVLLSILMLLPVHADALSTSGDRAAVARPGIDLIPPPLLKPPYPFSAVCPPTASLLTPAALGGLQPSAISATAIGPLYCLSVDGASLVGRRTRAVAPESRVFHVPSIAMAMVATGSTGVSASMASDVPESASLRDNNVRVPTVADASARPLQAIDCGEDQACDLRGAPTPSDAVTGTHPPPQEPEARPPGPAKAAADGHLLAAVGLFLLLWLALFCLLGGGCWIVYRRRFGPEARLIRSALAGLRRGEFRLEYQPVVRLGEGKCVGVEALIRWDNTEYGALGPLHYMSRLAHTKVMGPLTRFMLSTASRELGPLVEARSLYIGIDICAPHMESKTFVSDVRRSAKGILPRLVLHVPQGHCPVPTANILNAFASLRDKKVRFGLSGVGMSPVRADLLATFGFELVKTDREVLALDTDERIRRLVAVTDAVRASGATIIVEGVESANHHMVISQSGAEFGQGFFYGRAMVIHLLRTFLEAGGTSLRVRRARLW